MILCIEDIVYIKYSNGESAPLHWVIRPWQSDKKIRVLFSRYPLQASNFVTFSDNILNDPLQFNGDSEVLNLGNVDGDDADVQNLDVTATKDTDDTETLRPY